MSDATLGAKELEGRAARAASYSGDPPIGVHDASRPPTPNRLEGRSVNALYPRHNRNFGFLSSMTSIAIQYSQPYVLS